MNWKVKFFQIARGDYPVKEFIEELDRQTYVKALKTISLLEEFGPHLRSPYSKKIRDRLYELRIVERESIRIFYTYHLNEYYLLHSFKKKSKKTPLKEIKTALDRMQEVI